MATAVSGNTFDSPLLLSHSPSLLHQISEHGGYAYVSMYTLGVSGDHRAAEAAREMAWEQLHSGPWNSVLPVWRDAYSMACLVVAKQLCGNGEYKEALRVLDLGVIMGGETLRRDLDSAIAVTKAKESEGREVEGSGGKRLLVNAEFDLKEMLQLLPKQSLSCKLVGKMPALSLEAFLRDYFLSASPVILSDCMAHWPARVKWNDTDYLKKVAGSRTVPVEVGKNYLCTEWKQELITFSEFLERIQTNDSTSSVPTYLAQHPLFDQIPELRTDIVVPDYCFTGGGELRSINAWFGPAGTVTPLHHDPHHNILAQIVGKKYVRLYPDSLSEELCPHSESMLCNSSQVDLDNIDEKQFPNIQNLEFMDCILEEVSFWWSELENLTP
ncbi:lysine-specific demethylase JMJ30 [Heracleum sosnowskyi]|uniref:Lysine-specific demethylase JMJ30 n=1 Tax=Heracleum sosnowskyi TaxID=360622 RepID=A0AAD8GXQ4_9APIA|nr:lysine-specific demethylase JMJ30 [Heracleum sosnowskyi]